MRAAILWANEAAALPVGAIGQLLQVQIVVELPVKSGVVGEPGSEAGIWIVFKVEPKRNPYREPTRISGTVLPSAGLFIIPR